jgi:hypothetical protein
MTPSIGERIQILKTGPHDPACMEIIDELVSKLYTVISGKFGLAEGTKFPGSHRTVRPATGGLCCFWASLTPKIV